MKKCTICNKEKKINEFYKNRNSVEGFCKSCRYEKEKVRKSLNPEKYKEIQRLKGIKYRKTDFYKEYRKEYEKENRKKINQRNREYRLINRDKLLDQQRKWQHENKEKCKEYYKKCREKYPEKIKARKFLNHAIEYGYMTRKNNCEYCGLEIKVEAHHEDYNKPFDVIWLCRNCHAKRHIKT